MGLILRKRTIIIGIILLIVVAAFIFTPRFFNQSSEQQSTTVKKGDIQEELVLSGEIDAEEQAHVTFQAGGLISWVGVKEGDYVEKNQAIASLDTRSVQNQLQQDLNTYLQERSTLDITRENNQNVPQTDQVLQQILLQQQDVDNSVLQVELQQLAVNLSTIYSPISGVVTSVGAPVAGVNVSATQPPVYKVVNPSTIYFAVSADQTEVVDLYVGQTGTIYLDSYPDMEIRGEITNISFTPKTDETGAVYKVNVALDADNLNYRYRIGMSGDITFITDKDTSILYVPPQYIKTDEKGSYLLVGKDKKKQYVTVGIEGDDRVEVSGNIGEGDIIYD